MVGKAGAVFVRVWLLLLLIGFVLGGAWVSRTSAVPGHFPVVEGKPGELVIGVSGMSSKSLARLRSLTATYGGRVINKVSSKQGMEAIVVDLPPTSVPSFVAEAKSSTSPSYIEPNAVFRADFTPNDTDWTYQWGSRRIQADWAWNTTVGDPSVLVAVVDTGVDWHHPDLAANYVHLGFDWVNNDTDPMDDNSHGTHVAGIVAAVLDNGIGVAGTAQVKIMAEKGLNQSGYGTEVDLANAIIDAVDKGAKIINMSWGDYTSSSLIQNAIDYAYNAGVLLVASAGNDHTTDKLYPAAYSQVIAVSATDINDNPAYFSNYGNWIELSAPGVSIFSTLPNGAYGYKSGTSMAAPFVVGVAGLVWSRFPGMTRDQVRAQLRNTADDLGTPGFDPYYGYGRVDARRAVETQVTVHDIAVTGVLPEKTVVGQGMNIHVNVTVVNRGTVAETFSLTAYANATVIETRSLSLNITESTVATFVWNTTGAGKGNYVMSAYVPPVTNETNTANNLLNGGIVKVAMVGDITSSVLGVPDGKVDIRDLAGIAVAYGSYPNAPRWNPNADINDDGKVDIKDLQLAAENYGKLGP